MNINSPTFLYFNAASHGIPEPAVYEQMARFIDSEAELGPIRAAQQSTGQLRKVRNAAASLLGTTAEQIGFTSTTTAAWHAVVSQLELEGKKVLVSPHEWGDFYRALVSFSAADVEVLPPLDFEAPDLTSWADRINENTAAIFVPMITSIAGYRYPVEKIGALPRPKHTKLIIDAAQALGQTRVDIAQLNCDAVVSTCRKWIRGPRQTALFWLNEAWCSELGIEQTRTLEPADQSAAGILGLGVAIDHLLDQTVELTESRLRTRASKLRSWASRNGIEICGGNAPQSAIVSLILPTASASNIEEIFLKSNIVIKFPNVGSVEPTAEPLKANHAVLRISPHVYTSERDIDYLTAILSNKIL